MKRCPECGREYDLSMRFCLDDGAELLYGPASIGEPPTAILSEPLKSLTRSHIQTTDAEELSNARSKTASFTLNGTTKLLLGGILAALVMGAGLYWVAFNKSQRSASANTSLVIRRLTGDGQARRAVISPDGKYLAYQKVVEDKESLEIKHIPSNSTIPITKLGELERYWGLMFSPDSNYLYFVASGGASGGIYRVPTIGGTPPVKMPVEYVFRFSPDGKQIAFLREDQKTGVGSIYVADPDGLNERKVATRSGGQYFNTGAWSPDGKFFAVSTGDDALMPGPSQDVSLIRIDGGEMTRLGKTRWRNIDQIVWHPSGDSLIVCAADESGVSQLWEVLYPSGEVRQLTQGVNGFSGVSITSDGSALVTTEPYRRTSLWVSPDLDPNKAKEIIPANADISGVSWAPNNCLVYSSDQSGAIEIWRVSADGTGGTQLTSDRVQKTDPVASADGRYIVYAAGEQIFRIAANGGQPVVLNRSAVARRFDVSPDSQWVVYSAWVDGLSKIFRVPIDGGEPQVLTDSFSAFPKYSPDGRQIAWATLDETGQERLAIVPAGGGSPTAWLKFPPSYERSFVWMPDGKGVNFIASHGKFHEMVVVPLDGGEPVRINDTASSKLMGRAFSHDGKQIALMRGDTFVNAIMITNYR
jgi:Tol biopolymer transport system component